MTTGNDRRQPRNSLFLLAQCQLPDLAEPLRVKVRNISAGGLMVESPVMPLRGMPVALELRNIGWVDGVVAWVESNRFGVALSREIDPLAVRQPVSADTGGPDLVVRRPLAVALREEAIDPKHARPV